VNQPAPDDLGPIALERGRIVAPCVLFGILVGLVLSEPTGIPLSAPVLAWNALTISMMSLLSYVLLRRRLPARYGHAALAAIWWAAVSGGLVSQFFSGDTKLVFTYLVEIAGASFMLRTSTVIISFAIFDALWLPLTLRDGGPLVSMLMSSMVAAQLFALVFQRIHYKALVRAESSARALARQLEERDHLHEQLLHAQRMESIGTLAAGVAHDMNNILGSITNMAELLLEGSAPAQRPDVESILKQAARGGELTRGLLAFSRKGQYRKQPVVLDQLLEDLVPLFGRTLPKSVEIRTHFGARNAFVLGDPALLQQMVINLGVNAADAMTGTGVLEIATDTVELSDAEAALMGLEVGRHVVVRVADNGPGMDDATRRRAFEPFFTTKSPGKGTGLGLSTVWGIVQSHGGAIALASELGRGTTFTIHLPITAERAVERPAPVLRAPLPRTTVLVVDDEEPVRSSTIRLLGRHGLAAVGAANGAEALRVFAEEERSIGLVILDMGMPQMGGAECFAELRKKSDVPVLIATGYAIDTDASAMTAQGAALIEKPYSSRTLLYEVKRMLADGHHAQAAS
jgi:signal transduction histidine kinase/ActR/RegA family two-component response regulator